MKIIKEWYGKYGIIARLYVIPEGIFLDYKNCTETSKIFVTRGGMVQAQLPDVPKKYITEIQKMLKKGELN